MKQHSFFQKTGIILLSFILAAVAVMNPKINTASSASSGFSFIILSSYNRTVKIGQSFYLTAIAGNGKIARFTSSNSRVASVNTYGQVTAKKAGNCKITARVTGAEASCQVTVKKTEIILNAATISMENGAVYVLRGSTSNGSRITWKSSKKSVAIINDNGKIEALKPGETMITASADGSKRTCRVTVKKPKITLNRTEIILFRKQTFRLEATTSSGRTPAFSSGKGSVASIDETGLITGHRHGTTQIRVKLDGITRNCEVTVKSPEIQLTPAKATLKKGQTLTLRVNVSSGITPVFSSTKKSVATVDSRGKITAVGKGSCNIYVSEDGTKEICKITVTKS